MKVVIKELFVEMDIKNRGVEFQVNGNDGTLKGDCYVTRKGLIWCPGKTMRKNGIEISWQDFIEWMESE